MTNEGTHAEIISCAECDLLLDLSGEVAPSHTLYCPRCKHKLLESRPQALDHTIALCSTALIVLCIANSFPFLTLEAQGQSSTISLIDSAYALFAQGYPVLSVLIVCFIVVLPMIYLCLLLMITVPIKLGINRRPPIVLGLLVQRLLPWSMAEVFLIGVLVALIKIVALAGIVIGLSFWAYILFTVLFLQIACTVDSHQLWSWVDNA